MTENIPWTDALLGFHRQEIDPTPEATTATPTPEEELAQWKAKVEEHEKTIATLNQQVSNHVDGVRRVRESWSKQDAEVREWAIEKVACGDLSRSLANELMTIIAAEPITGKYRGDAIFPDGSRIRGILFEADDEDGWKDKVREEAQWDGVVLKYRAYIEDDEGEKDTRVEEDDYDIDLSDNYSWIDFANIEEV